MRRMMVHDSASAAMPSTGVTSGTPQASNSRMAGFWPPQWRKSPRTRVPPTPIPKISRPCAIRSVVAAILARTAGGRVRLLLTSRPSRSRSVCAASAASSVHPS